jgi:ATP-dependent DNA helicase RecQ
VITDGKIPAQMALSCVYRTGQRFGVKYLIDNLLGNSTEQMQRFQHDKVSTFGVGKDYSSQQWNSIFRQLIAANLLTIDMSAFGSVRLTELSKPLLKGESGITLRIDPDKPRKSKSTTKKDAKISGKRLSAPSDNLWHALKEKRMELAKSQGVPPYVIFHDSSLIEMHEKRPQSLEEFKGISGVGESKLARYGEIFVQLIQSSLADAIA